MLTEVVDWHTLGIKLDLPDQTLKKIEIDYSASGTDRQRQKMISSWLKHDPECSWSKLANALEKMGNNTLAVKIWDQSRFVKTALQVQEIIVCFIMSLVNCIPVQTKTYT